MSVFTENSTKITPEQAKMWLDSANYERQRTIRPRKVKFYAKCMEEGRFYPTNTIAFAVCKKDKQTYLINGYHTLNAIVKSGKTQHLPVVRHSADDIGGVDTLYAHYDIGTSRTYNDAVRAYGAATSYGITGTDINALSASVKYILAEFPKNYKNVLIPSEDVLILLDDWIEALLLYKEALSGAIGGQSRFYAKSIMSVALVTAKYQPEKAADFWGRAARLENVTVENPAAKLRWWLDMVRSDGGSSGNNRAYNGAIARTVAYCWNKDYQNQSIRQLKTSYIDDDGAFELLGTPLKDGNMKLIEYEGVLVN